jgi:hypothetical protein
MPDGAGNSRYSGFFRVWRLRVRTGSIVVSAGDAGQVIIVRRVDQPVALVDPTGPEARPVFPQKLRLTDPGERRPQGVGVAGRPVEDLAQVAEAFGKAIDCMAVSPVWPIVELSAPAAHGANPGGVSLGGQGGGTGEPR